MRIDRWLFWSFLKAITETEAIDSFHVLAGLQTYGMTVLVFHFCNKNFKNKKKKHWWQVLRNESLAFCFLDPPPQRDGERVTLGFQCCNDILPRLSSFLTAGFSHLCAIIFYYLLNLNVRDVCYSYSYMGQKRIVVWWW